MTPDELIDVVGFAYGEPGGEIAEALFSLVHETYFQGSTDYEQAEALLSVLGHVDMRLHKVIAAVGLLRVPLKEPLDPENM